MAQLDINVVVAALPSIGRDLAAPSAVAGVTAVYLLSVTVATPVLGRLGDLLGRRTVFAGAVLLFAAGSLACALAPTMTALVAARALQGLGGGGLVVTAVSSLPQMFDRAELVRRQIWLTAVTAIAALGGPPAGAALAAGPDWRWIFTVNLPLCAAALLLGLRGLPGRQASGGLSGFDTTGTALITLGGGAVVALGSSARLATSPRWAALLLALIASCTVAFVRRERRAQAPLIPPRLFNIPALSRSIAVTGLTGAALFGTFTFVPLAVAAGTGASTAQVGTLLLALTAGQLAVTTTFSLLARRYPRMVPWGRTGLAMGIAGLALLAVLPHLRHQPEPVAVAVAVLGMALTGAALGLSLQAYTLLAQSSAPPDSFGAALGTLTFARQLGGSIGTAALGSLLLNITNPNAALTAGLAAAAGVTAIALLLAPRQQHEPQPTR